VESPKTIALYLPQFYPIFENNGWYGTGFTDWANVAKAQPLFEGHYQPRLPADLGFYDLRVRDVREQQARLARRHGIDAFCYYHYWFEGQRPLSRVVDDQLATNSPRMPFCLAWANENWSRHWDATEYEILLRQRYSAEDDEEHGKFLLKAMSHPLYLRLDGKPILFIYRIQALPDPAGTIARWREMWRQGAIGDVHIVKFDSWGDTNEPAKYGADAAAQFFPHGAADIVPKLAVDDADPGNTIYHYDDVVSAYLGLERPPWTRYECVVPSWDNTSRRGNGRSNIVHSSTPEAYEKWLAGVRARTPADGLILINAWNEWAEGAYLEPDQRHGMSYLQATARALGVEVDKARRVVPTDIPDDYVALYLDALDSATRLQTRLSRLEGMIDRLIAAATESARARAAEAIAQASAMSTEIERLQRLLEQSSQMSSSSTGPPEVSGARIMPLHR
jgi:Glycosyltransferase WbsX